MKKKLVLLLIPIGLVLTTIFALGVTRDSGGVLADGSETVEGISAASAQNDKLDDRQDTEPTDEEGRHEDETGSSDEESDGWDSSFSGEVDFGPPPVESLDDVLFANFAHLSQLSDIIVIGRVDGVHEHGDNTLQPVPEGSDPSWFSHSERRLCNPNRDIRFDISVEEVIKGDPASPLILGKPTSYFNDAIHLAKLVEGDRVLLFASEITPVSTVAEEESANYWILGDNAIFDLDDQYRAFPRIPFYFDSAAPVGDDYTFGCLTYYEESDQYIGSPIPAIHETTLELNVGEEGFDPYLPLDSLIEAISEQIESMKQ